MKTVLRLGQAAACLGLLVMGVASSVGMVSDLAFGGFALPDWAVQSAYATPKQNDANPTAKGAAAKSRSKVASKKTSPKKVASRSDSPFKTAQRDFASLREKDPECEDLRQWEEVATSFREIVENGSDPKVVPPSLFNLGRLYERTYKKRGYSIGLTRALFFYEKLARDHPGHVLADDSLLALGDLRRNDLKDETAARAAFFEIIDMYPAGDVVQEARKRVGTDQRRAVVSTAKHEAGVARSGENKAVSSVPPIVVGGANESPAAGSVATSILSSESSSAVSESVHSSSVDRGESSSAMAVIGELPKRPMIVIDPGHGGDDEGAVGVDGTLEKEVTLNIAIYLDELLRDRLRAQTLLTRGRDVVVPLAERTKMANDANADLFISIHTNASPKKNVAGIETYYLDNTNDQSSLKLAERENASMTFGGGDLGFMISDLIQNLKLDESISLAHHIQGSLVDTLGKYYRDVKGLGVKKAPFYVLVGAHMPCVLTEVSFIDHPVEGARLVDRKYQKLIAEALYRGIRDFFEKQARRLPSKNK